MKITKLCLTTEISRVLLVSKVRLPYAYGDINLGDQSSCSSEISPEDAYKLPDIKHSTFRLSQSVLSPSAYEPGGHNINLEFGNCK